MSVETMTNVVSFAGATGKSLVLSDVLSRQEFKTSTLQPSTEINLQAYFAQVRERRKISLRHRGIGWCGLCTKRCRCA